MKTLTLFFISTIVILFSLIRIHPAYLEFNREFKHPFLTSLPTKTYFSSQNINTFSNIELKEINIDWLDGIDNQIVFSNLKTQFAIEVNNKGKMSAFSNKNLIWSYSQPCPKVCLIKKILIWNDVVYFFTSSQNLFSIRIKEWKILAVLPFTWFLINGPSIEKNLLVIQGKTGHQSTTKFFYTSDLQFVKKQEI